VGSTEREKVNRTEKRKEYRRKYHLTHLEQERKNSHNWYITHLDQARKGARKRGQLRLGQLRETHRAWGKKHPEKCRKMTRRHRQWKITAAGYFYTTDRHICGRWEMWGNRCYLCGAPAKVTDHVIPLSKGGSHWPANLRPICQSCNAAKGAKSLTSFLKEK